MNRRTTRFSNERRCKILMFLYEYQAANKFPPNIRQIGEEADISSTSVVNYYLDILQEEGYVVRVRGISRGSYLSPAGEVQARYLLGIISLHACEHCGAPLGHDGRFKKKEKIRDSYPIAT